jgi:uncharacterized protein (TIGR02145 family)
MKKNFLNWIPFFVALLLLLALADCCKRELSSDSNKLKSAKIKNLKGRVADIDGNVYKIVSIGTQDWMTENLKVTRYQNGDPIQLVTDKYQWLYFGSSRTGAFCNYNNDINYVETYGCLYNAYAATDTRNIAPIGWHVPTEADWMKLSDYLGGVNIAGGKLKEAETLHWLNPNTCATNELGFTALPGGGRIPIEPEADFTGIGSVGYWYSSTWRIGFICQYSLQYDDSKFPEFLSYLSSSRIIYPVCEK